MALVINFVVISCNLTILTPKSAQLRFDIEFRTSSSSHDIINLNVYLS